jgi:hypothetical protein
MVLEHSKLTPAMLCGCCQAGESAPAIFNRPGLPALAYRIGTHVSFLRWMLARLPSQTIPDGPNAQARPLTALTTRSSDDPAIALLDAWATVADVLTFYQERIANEGYLRTATERLSVLELARTIGYELNPGVAASTFLTFIVEDAPGAPGVATVPAGTRVQSIPAQGQLLQTFETVEGIQARAERNALRPRLTEPQQIVRGTKELYLKGITPQLQPGDPILLVGDERAIDAGSERWDFRILHTVTPFPKEGYTLVTWEEGLGDPTTLPAAQNIRAYAFRQRAALFGHNAPDWRSMPDSVKKAYKPDFDPQGHTPANNPGPEWPNFAIQTAHNSVIDLDAAYPKILPGSWLVLVRQPGQVELYKVVNVSISSRTDFTLTSKTTRIKLDAKENLDFFGLRATVAWAQSEPLELIERPLLRPVHSDKIVLNQLVPGLVAGQILMVSGKRIRVMLSPTATDLFLNSADGSKQVALQPGDTLQVMAPPAVMSGSHSIVLPPDELLAALHASQPVLIQWLLMDRDSFIGMLTASSHHLILQPADPDDPTVKEVASIKDVSSDRDRTCLMLRDPLHHIYDRTTVTISANVARATHGETVRDEVLGSGDGAQPNQRFTLKKPPLTYVSAPTPSGAQSTLHVRVNSVLWGQAASLFGLAARSQSYIVRLDGDGKTRVIFGDGEMGARLPTGTENVVATYRSGIGLAGNLAVDQLTLLPTRPLGIRNVTNPLAADGGADPEVLEDARTNAPLTVLTLDRIVSLQDFADFARAFAGIGKARAVALWSGEHRLVHLTVAAANGDEIPITSELYTNLVKAIDAQRDPGQRVEVASFKRRTFRVTAQVLVDPRYRRDDVFAQIQSALLRTFSFANRDFGQSVTAAEVVTAIQGVAGVVAAALATLTLDPAQGTSPPPAILQPHIAQRADEITELLLLDPQGISLLEMTP